MNRVLRALGAPIRLPLLGLVRLWRHTLGRVLGPRCRFHPSCSSYADEAISRHGAAKGLALAVWRVLRCSPLSAGGPDPVPPRGAWTHAYDGVIPGGGA